MDSLKGNAKYLRHSELTIYTGGSKTSHGTGSGYVIYKNNTRIRTFSCKISDNATVFQAEIYAIYKASEYLIGLTADLPFKYVKILSDSQAALQALNNPIIKSKLVNSTVDSLDSLQTIIKKQG